LLIGFEVRTLAIADGIAQRMVTGFQFGSELRVATERKKKESGEERVRRQRTASRHTHTRPFPHPRVHTIKAHNTRYATPLMRKKEEKKKRKKGQVT
jgi:hypothetical protein